MEFSEKGLVLKVGRFREIDAWVRLFSPTRGSYTAFAFGGLKSRRRFLGCLDPLNHVLFKVRSVRRTGYHYLTEARLLAAPTRLRGDPGRLGLAVNCLKFLEAVHIGPQGAQAAYDLLLAVLGALEAEAAPSALFPMLFRARMAFGQGLLPEGGRCARCGASLGGGNACFLVEAGQLLCQDCRDAAPGPRLPLGSGALALWDAAVTAAPGDWAAAAPDGKAAREFSQAVDMLVRYHLGLAWDNGTFVRT